MNARFSWWNNLRHGGLLLDTQRLTELVPEDPPGLSSYDLDRLRRRLTQFQDDNEQHRGKLVSFVLETICGFARPLGEWYRGSEVSTKWSRRAITGESVRPRHLWIGKNAAALPVFVDDEPRVGAGRGRRTISHVLQWLRQGSEQLALVTNGQEWRLLFAGLDYEAFCQWDADAWFAEGDASPELNGFRALMHPTLWTPAKKDEPCRLLAAVNDSRKGQADLSQVLGERVRQAAELLIQAHTPVLKDQIDGPASQDIYRAAVRMIMRLVVVLFAESREGLLARDNPVFHTAYSLQGLREQLQRINQHKLVGSAGAWFRVLALLRLIHQGSSHPDLPVPAYGGELFAPGRSEDADGMKRALHLFETACFGADVMTDYQVRQILDLLTRTKVKIRQGKASMLISAPVDFSSLGSEYIGILYEGLLDFELRCAVENEPIVFLAVGNQPALPLSTLERMDDRAIKNLLEKLKDTSSSADDDEEASGEQGDDADEEVEKPAAVDEEPGEEVEEEVGEEEAVEEVPSDDPRFTLKTRAEAWARRVCEIGKLVAKPRGKLTPERRMQFEKALDGKARQLVVKVVLPGEWYLVRWGGTRKGSGTFYTRPQLAIPTVHRTLRPLAYNPPTGDDGQPDQDAPASKWTPKKPDEILSLKVCDPACGSGSFPLAALRFLTEALYESLRAHGRIRDHGGRAVLDLIYDEETHETLASEPLPCRPDDDDFETRTKAILRRYVVERCIYGVDIDPLAVELCRLSLWIETLDRSLPLTFLNHKIKCGNSLVGAWFDQFLHYPAMAWQREGGDKNHSNGVHFKKEAWTKAIKEFAKKVKSDLIEFIDGGRFQSMFSVDLATVQTGHDAAEAALKKIHSFGIAQVDQRAACYDALLASPEFQNLKAAFDLWCSLWFWPADGLDHAPLPTQFAAGQIDAQGREIVGQVARRHRFFHWELEFPDVFNAQSHGFDAVLGNPPWEISKPNSKEFFSTFDPLYRGYGKQEAVRRQTELFEQDSGLEHRWLDYCAALKAMSNWVKFAGFPFGDRVTVNSQGKESHDLNLGDRGASSFATSHRRHQRWKAKREESAGYADAEHSFRHQGSADINLYKLFLEQAHALLTENGRLGLIVPSGLYSDFGTGDLRRLFVDRCRWEWLFGFENREGIFDIHRSFKFNPVIIAKGGQTQAIRTAFMRRGLADWEKGEQFVTHYTREQVVQFSPNSRAILEIQSQRDLEVLTKIYANSVLLGDQSENGWGIQYAREFDMTNDSKLFPPRPKWEEWGYRPDEYSRWIKGPWKPVERLWAELGRRSRSAPCRSTPSASGGFATASPAARSPAPRPNRQRPATKHQSPATSAALSRLTTSCRSLGPTSPPA
ncbi:MAG: Eco57I restriction-modification methylase domain-containing protein [Thermoguttaceae bacterium]